MRSLLLVACLAALAPASGVGAAAGAVTTGAAAVGSPRVSSASAGKPPGEPARLAPGRSGTGGEAPQARGIARDALLGNVPGAPPLGNVPPPAPPPPGATSTMCRDISRLPKDADFCSFAREYCESEELIDAFTLYYCYAHRRGVVVRASFVAACLLSVALLFRVVSRTADEYFSVILTQVSRDAGVPPRLAGVTLLALGNGAPDLSSAVAAVEAGKVRLALGGLTGGAMIVSCVVAGRIVLNAGGVRCRAAQVRDVSTLLLAIVGVGILLLRGTASALTASLMLAAYGLYVLAVAAADLTRALGLDWRSLSFREVRSAIGVRRGALGPVWPGTTPLAEPLLGGGEGGGGSGAARDGLGGAGGRPAAGPARAAAAGADQLRCSSAPPRTPPAHPPLPPLGGPHTLELQEHPPPAPGWRAAAASAVTGIPTPQDVALVRIEPPVASFEPRGLSAWQYRMRAMAEVAQARSFNEKRWGREGQVTSGGTQGGGVDLERGDSGGLSDLGSDDEEAPEVRGAGSSFARSDSAPAATGGSGGGPAGATLLPAHPSPSSPTTVSPPTPGRGTGAGIPGAGGGGGEVVATAGAAAPATAPLSPEADDAAPAAPATLPRAVPRPTPAFSTPQPSPAALLAATSPPSFPMPTPPPTHSRRPVAALPPPHLVGRHLEDPWEYDAQAEGSMPAGVRGAIEHALGVLLSSLEAPLMTLLRATIPIVEQDAYSRGWFAVSCGVIPVSAAVYLFHSSMNEAAIVPLVLLALGGCTLGSKATAGLPRGRAPTWPLPGSGYPLGALLVALVGFSIAAAWIDLFASEIVGLLHFLGQLFAIDDALMGVTVLAWGNSIMDYVTNSSMAGRSDGGTSMAMTACFAGPVFNLLLGVGAGLLARIRRVGSPVPVHFDPVVALGCVAVVCQCAATVFVAARNSWSLPPAYGKALLSWYGVYLTLAILLVLLTGADQE